MIPAGCPAPILMRRKNTLPLTDPIGNSQVRGSREDCLSSPSVIRRLEPRLLWLDAMLS
jgi:hypothetical protein